MRIDDSEGKRFFPVTPWLINRRIEWLCKGFAVPHPLYFLDELAVSDDDPVLIVEGEKTADAAQELLESHVVMTWQGGANAVGKTDWSPLAGRDVVIWPDADKPGIKAAEAVARKLRKVGAKSIKIIDLPDGLPKGWDLADKVPDEVDIHQLLKQARNTTVDLSELLLSASDLAEREIPEREMIVAPFILANSINMVFAPRGLGKTWFALLIGIAIARGLPFIGYAVPEARRVLFVDGEMPLADLKARVKAIGADNIHNLDILASEIMHSEFHSLNIYVPEDRQAIDAMLDKMQIENRAPSLIIFDNLSSLRMGGKENDNSDLDDILRWFLHLRHKGYAILIVHHAGKGGDQRGASRLEDLLDTTIKLEPLKETVEKGAAFELKFTKTRGVAPDPNELTLFLRKNENGLLFLHHDELRKISPADHTLKVIHLGPNKDGIARFEQQTDIAEISELKKPAISKHITKLSKLGYMNKKSLSLTTKGWAHLLKQFPDLEKG